MRSDLLLQHASLHRLSRREAVELTAKAGAAGALARFGVGAQNASAGRKSTSRRFTDEMFDVEAVLSGAWDDTAFYRRGTNAGRFGK